MGGGFVQSIFSPPSRRPPFECFPNVSRRDADLKILCIMSSKIKCGVSGTNVLWERTAGHFTRHYPKTLLLSGDRLVGEEDAR